LEDSRPGDLFRIPERRRRTRSDEGLTAAGARAWADALPLANIGQTARRLFERLDRLNEIEIPPVERYTILETHHPALELVLQSLTRRYVNHDLPLTGRAVLVARLARELMFKAVIGYKIVEHQITSGSLPSRLRYKRRQGQALHRKLHFLSRLLLQDFQLYRRHRKGLWREIHQSYECARQSRLAHRPFDNVNTRFACRSSIEDLYKQGLLLSLCGPYGLLQGDIDRVFNGLYEWAPLCHLGSQPEESTPTPWFLVDPEDDAPPKFMHNSAPVPTRGWVLNPEPLLDRLAQRIDELHHSSLLPGGHRPHDEPVPFSAELLSRLLLAWGHQRNREAPRKPSSGRLMVACGMGSLMALLGVGVQELVRGQTNESSGSGADRVDGDSQLQLGDWTIDLDSTMVENIAVGSTDENPAFWARKEDTSRAQILTCDIIDRSATGFHIRAEGQQYVNPRVGELVAIRDDIGEGPAHSWRVGTVRWMHVLSSEDIRCGIQILANRSEPVLVRWWRQRTGEDEDLPALLLKGQGDMPDTLVTRTFFASPHDRLSLVRRGTVEPIMFDRALERSQSYVQFAFSHVGGPDTARTRHRPEPIRAKKEAADESDEFDGIWGSL
jgi:hypothetical protein